MGLYVREFVSCSLRYVLIEPLISACVAIKKGQSDQSHEPQETDSDEISNTQPCLQSEIEAFAPEYFGQRNVEPQAEQADGDQDFRVGKEIDG